MVDLMAPGSEHQMEQRKGCQKAFQKGQCLAKLMGKLLDPWLVIQKEQHLVDLMAPGLEHQMEQRKGCQKAKHLE